jgi:hypothetical protein
MTAIRCAIRMGNHLSLSLEHDAPKLTDFGDNIMLQIIDFDHVYDFGLIQSKIIVI